MLLVTGVSLIGSNGVTAADEAGLGGRDVFGRK